MANEINSTEPKNPITAKRRKRWFHQVLVAAHRYIGLAIAALLILECLTGCVAVYKNELDCWLNASLCYCEPPSSNARPMEPLKLREEVDRQLPKGLSIWELSLVGPEPGMSADFTVNFDDSGPNPNIDVVYANPYTGKLMGTRQVALNESWRNIVPFIFEIHHSLALGEFGMWVLGALAVVWTIDCFVAMYLTFPMPVSKTTHATKKRSWLVRWLPSWLVQASSSFAAIFTFHRASGLWIWLFLMMFAWSSVALRMMNVYEPVTKLFFAGYDYEELPSLQVARHHPKLTWVQALALGQSYMQKESESRGFTIDRPFILSHEPYAGFFRYQVQSNLDPSNRWCDTVVWMDSDTGKFVIFWAPTGLNSGGTFSTWLKYLHFGWVGGELYRIAIFIIGLLTAVLTATGVLIWWRKLRGRIRSTGVTYDRISLLKLLSKDLAIATVVFLTCCVVTYFIFHNSQEP